MAMARRRARGTIDIWPGWVDALSTLLIIILFVLLVFVLGQFFLSQILTRREATIGELNVTVSGLTDSLNLERKARSELETNLARITDQLNAANQQVSTLSQLKLDLEGQLATRTQELAVKTDEAASLTKSLETATAEITANKEEIEKQIGDIALLQSQVRAMEALREKLEKEAKDLGTQLARSNTTISEERRLSAQAQAQVALMTQEIEELQRELARLSATLDASDALTAEQKAQISDLGRRMNRALAGKVQELQRYRLGRPLRVPIGSAVRLGLGGTRHRRPSAARADRARAAGSGRPNSARRRLGAARRWPH
jgi:chemotaxis protein MotB